MDRIKYFNFMTKGNRYKLLFTISLSLFILTTHAQSAYQKGWDSFLNNHRAEARSFFIEATNDKKTESDAYLSLSLLSNAEGKTEEAFNFWTKFCNTSPQTDALLYTSSHFPFAFSARNALKNEKLELLRSLHEKEGLNGYVKALMQMSLGYHYQGVKDNQKAKELFRSTGMLYDWQILGKFDNTSGGGFHKDWGAVEKASTAEKFTNELGAEVHWFYPGENQSDGWFYPTHHLDSPSSITYAQCFVNSQATLDAILNIGVSGSIKAWINDALVISIEDERNTGIDVYATQIKLNKGYNRILLQLGDGEVSSANFYVRFTDNNGHPIKGLTHTHTYNKYNKGRNNKSLHINEFYPEKELKHFIQENQENVLYTYMLVEQYLLNDKTDEAMELLFLLLTRFPTSSLLHSKLSEAFSRSKNHTYATQEMEAILSYDPDSFAGLTMLIGIAQESNKVNEVKKLYEKLIQLYGESPYSIRIDQWIASQENNLQKRRSIAQKQYEKHPESFEMMNNLYQITENLLKDSKGAKQIIENYYNQYQNDYATQVLSSIYMKEGDSEKALMLLEELIEKAPYNSGYYLNYGYTLLNMQRYDKALDIANRLMKVSPFNASTYMLIAKIHKEKGDNEEAIANFEKTLYYYPGYFEALDQLRLLGARKELEEYFPKNKLDSLISIAGNYEDYPEDHSLIILETNDNLHHTGGAQEKHKELAVKIFNQSGIDTWKEYWIQTFSGEYLIIDKAEIIKPNGQKTRAESNGGQVVFTGLEIGDVLHLDYRIKSYFYNTLATKFAETHLFQGLVPYLYSRHTLALPHDLSFDYQFANGNLEPTITQFDNKKLYKWEAYNQPSIKSEPYMAAPRDVAPTLVYSNYPDWEFIRKWYQDLTANKFKADFILKNAVANILEGKENVSDTQKAKLFYEYIIKNISYINTRFTQDNLIPQKASHTLSTRLGDCKDVATLFTAMCKIVGIDANVILVSTKGGNDYNKLLLPSIAFDHAIAELNADGKRYILELTSDKLPFGSVYEMLLESNMLSIKTPNKKGKDYLERVRVPHRTPNNITRYSQITMKDNGFQIKYKATAYGSLSAHLRNQYADLGIEEQRKDFNEAAAERYKAKTAISNLEFENLNNLEDSATYSYNLFAENMLHDLANMKIFKLSWADGKHDLKELALENRKFPFLNWAYNVGDVMKEIIMVSIPEGMRLLETPEDIYLECANASYSLRFDSSQKGIFKVTREFISKTEIVSVEEYPAFSKFMSDVSMSDNKLYAVE